MTMVCAITGWTALLSGMIVSGTGPGLTNPALAPAAAGTAEMGQDPVAYQRGSNEPQEALRRVPWLVSF